MVYVDKSGQKCEYQYCVVLKEGKNAGIKQYFWADKITIRRFFKDFNLEKGKKGRGIKHIVDMSHYIFDGDPNNIKKSKKSARIEFIKGFPESLEVYADTEEDANKCLEYFHFR